MEQINVPIDPRMQELSDLLRSYLGRIMDELRWLRMPNGRLGARSPQSLIDEGRVNEVNDFLRVLIQEKEEWIQARVRGE